ncbi:Myosin light chain alkali [Apis cerana cerana]|uniref:Myosin light chain alkali n=1 Tax=Apis cerana cerana TaxID=94128 RepID=A0A2A3E5W5_APICC|nr:Myosin light chain alkali [Apis cerana cerana]
MILKSQIESLFRIFAINLQAEFAFSIYDADGTNVIDATDLGNVLRALNLNPTNATIEKLGGTKKKGEKLMKLDEFLPIYSQCKKDKDQGCYEDFVECLKLYDKQENGTMLGAELSHTLLALGEKLTDAEVEEVLKDCMDPEDEDGFIPYTRKHTVHAFCQQFVQPVDLDVTVESPAKMPRKSEDSIGPQFTPLPYHLTFPRVLCSTAFLKKMMVLLLAVGESYVN